MSKRYIWYNKLNLDFPDWKDHPEIKGNSNKETYVLLYKLTKLKQKLRLKQNIYELYTLEKLNIFSNITELPKEIGALTNLKQLNLVSSNITRLPKEIGMLTNLIYLNLKNNKFSSFPVEICMLTNLKGLELENNKITTLPKEIGMLTNLENLDLTNNNISKLPVEIINLTNLKYVILRGNEINKISEIPKYIRDKLKNTQFFVGKSLYSGY